MIDIQNRDCMELLKETPDKFYDLAIVDPPYGIGLSNNPVRQQHQKKDWDSSIPNDEYFTQLFRASKNQIIWGGNYFIECLYNTQGFLIWDKVQPHDFSLSMCEFAWSSIESPAKIFKQSVLLEKNKIHPTQKPVQLYKWLLKNYAKEGDRILDTHCGSGSIAIACYDMGFDLTATELDKDYYEASLLRLENHKKQLKLF